MANVEDKIIREQSKKLCALLIIPENTFFEISELEAIEKASWNEIIPFRGVTVRISPSAKALAGILLEKIKAKAESETLRTFKK